MAGGSGEGLAPLFRHQPLIAQLAYARPRVLAVINAALQTILRYYPTATGAFGLDLIGPDLHLGIAEWAVEKLGRRLAKPLGTRAVSHHSSPLPACRMVVGDLSQGGPGEEV